MIILFFINSIYNYNPALDLIIGSILIKVLI